MVCQPFVSCDAMRCCRRCWLQERGDRKRAGRQKLASPDCVQEGAGRLLLQKKGEARRGVGCRSQGGNPSSLAGGSHFSQCSPQVLFRTLLAEGPKLPPSLASRAGVDATYILSYLGTIPNELEGSDAIVQVPHHWSLQVMECTALLCKNKEQYLITCKGSRYCFLPFARQHRSWHNDKSCTLGCGKASPSLRNNQSECPSISNRHAHEILARVWVNNGSKSQTLAHYSPTAGL